MVGRVWGRCMVVSVARAAGRIGTVLTGPPWLPGCDAFRWFSVSAVCCRWPGFGG